MALFNRFDVLLLYNEGRVIFHTKTTKRRTDLMFSFFFFFWFVFSKTSTQQVYSPLPAPKSGVSTPVDVTTAKGAGQEPRLTR